MFKNLTKGISTPIAMAIVVTLAILVGAAFYWQSLKTQREGFEIAEVEMPETEGQPIEKTENQEKITKEDREEKSLIIAKDSLVTALLERVRTAAKLYQDDEGSYGGVCQSSGVLMIKDEIIARYSQDNNWICNDQTTSYCSSIRLSSKENYYYCVDSEKSGYTNTGCGSLYTCRDTNYAYEPELGEYTSREKDLIIKSALERMRVSAVLYYDKEVSYKGICQSSEMMSVRDIIKYSPDKTWMCNDGFSYYCVSIRLNAPDQGDSYCVDFKGNSGVNSCGASHTCP